MAPENNIKTYEEFQRELMERKRGRWVEILSTEPKERVFGRRPRDPLKEELLLRLDKIRLAKERKKNFNNK